MTQKIKEILVGTQDIHLDHNTIKLKHKFNTHSCRHTIDGIQSVLHCHHYMTLTTQMAEDAEDLCGGTNVLITTMQDVAYKTLMKIFNEHKINDVDDKVAVAEQLFSIWALGKIEFVHIGDYSATVNVYHSHVDEGWIKKWDKRDKPVGYINRGYVQGALAAIDNRCSDCYDSREELSIVKGDKNGLIKVWLR